MRLYSCCGCCTLQTGSIVIGILSLVLKFFSLISLSIFAARIEYVSNPQFQMGMYYITKSMIVGIIFYLIATLAISALLIAGAIKRNANYVFPFLCVAVGNNVASFGVAVGYFTYSCIYPGIPPPATIILFLMFGVALTIQTYLCLIIFNFYKQLVAEKYGHTLENGGQIYQKSFDNRV